MPIIKYLMETIISLVKLSFLASIVLVTSSFESKIELAEEKLKSFVYSKKKNFVMTRLKFDFEQPQNETYIDMSSYNPKPKSERIPVAISRYNYFESNSYFKELIDESIKVNHHEFQEYTFYLNSEKVSCKLPYKSIVEPKDENFDFIYYNPSTKYLKHFYMFVLMEEVSKICFSTGLPQYYIKICPLNSVHKQLAEYKKHANGTEYIEYTNLGEKKNFTLEDDTEVAIDLSQVYEDSNDVNIRELLKEHYYDSSLTEYDEIHSKKYMTVKGRIAKLFNQELKDISANETEIVVEYTLNEIINHLQSIKEVGVFIDSISSRNDHTILSSFLKNSYGEGVVKAYFEPRFLKKVSRESLIELNGELWESKHANIIIPVSRRIIKVVSGNILVLNREFITESFSTAEFELKVTNQKSRSSGMIEIVNYISISRNIVFCKGCDFYFNYASGDFLVIVSNNNIKVIFKEEKAD